MIDMAKLNENQLRAVQWDQGPLLVLAGPGSGKTLVLTMRVARLIQESADARFRVLGLTFTTKAADEMRQRVEGLLGQDARRARLTTFHSFCAEVLRQHGSHLGLRPDYEILTQDKDRVAVIDEAIREAAVPDMPAVDGRGIVKLMDHLLREGFDAEEDTELPLVGSDTGWIRPVFQAYTRILFRKNHLDYGMLLICCLRLFRTHPRIAKHYRIVYPFICVDEYQDTNKAQDRLLRALCETKDANLFVVADDDQILYQWNGASPDTLKHLRRDYDMPVIQLPESYRCPPAVIELANNLIRYNLERSPDKGPLIAALPALAGDAVRFRQFGDHQREMSWVAKDIAGRSLLPEHCAILARNTKLLQAAADALREAGMSPYLTERKDEFASAPLRFVHAALRLANAPQDHEQLRRLCKAFFDLSNEDVRVENAAAESAIYGGALLRGFIEAAAARADDAIVWWPLVDAMRNSLSERLKYREFVDVVFEWCSTRREELGGTDEDYADEIDEIAVWKTLRRHVRDHFGDDPTLSQFLQELDLRQKTTPPRDQDVQCLTVHLSKGKEFQHVYLVGLAEEQLPSYQALQKGAHSRELEEERRNCFVAITRVQSSLTLTSADVYFGWPKRPSRFLREMGIEGEQVAAS